MGPKTTPSSIPPPLGGREIDTPWEIGLKGFKIILKDFKGFYGISNDFKGFHGILRDFGGL